MRTNSPTMPKMLYVTGFIFENLGLVLCTSRRKTRKRRQQSTCHGSQSGWKGLSLFPQSSRHTVQSCCRSLQILRVLTLSHQLQDTDVMGLSESLWILSIYAVKVRAVKTYSEHIFDALTFSIELSVALLDVDISALICVYAHMCLRVHTQWLTLHSPCQIKAWKMVWSKKRASPSLVVALVIWSIPCNYRDLCRPTFQGEFVSQPPVEIWSVLNWSNTERRGEGSGELQ